MYTFITQYNSPNYTPGSDAKRVWGKPRTLEAIAGHWRDDPFTSNLPMRPGLQSQLTPTRSRLKLIHAVVMRTTMSTVN